MSDWGDIVISDIEGYGVKKDTIALWSLGGAGFVLRTMMTTVYIDPYLSGSILASEWGPLLRVAPIPFNPEQIKKADAVIITHEHEDHCDRHTLEWIVRNTKAMLIGPKPCIDLMKKWGFNEEYLRLVKGNDEVRIKDLVIKAYDGMDVPYALMYVIKTPVATLFHSGDTKYCEKFAKIGNENAIDIAMLNYGGVYNGIQPYMLPFQFLYATRDLGAKKAIPMHWDLWRNYYMDPTILQQIARQWLPQVNVHILRVGERLTYP